MMLMMMVTIMMMVVPCEFYSFCGLKGPLSGIQLTASPPLRLVGGGGWLVVVVVEVVE